MHCLRIRIPCQPGLTQLAANTTLLDATKRHSEIRVIARVNPDHARLQTSRKRMRTRNVLCENSGSKTISRPVRHLNRLLLGLEAGNNNEGAEYLLLVDRHAWGDILEDRWLDEKALSVADICECLTAADKRGTFILAGLCEAEDALVLSLCDLWALGRGLYEGIADDLDFGDVLGELGDEFIVDSFMDEDAGGGAADLALVGEDADVLF
jgi:hypothetical protein